MVNILIGSIAILLYLAANLLLVRRLFDRNHATSKLPALIIGLVATLLHAASLSSQAFTPNGLNLGFTLSASLAMLFISSLLLTSSFKNPIENLGILILPLSAIALLVQLTYPTTHILPPKESMGLGVHILLSILAYSLLSLAAVQALLLAFQERHLHARHPGGVIRALPPLETMETLLFQMIIIGFSLQTMSLASGAVYLEDMLAQHLAHKTILSILAWLVFATLLWGRWRYGWRGRTAIRWTLSGFFALLLAYFGSKYVLEIILER